MGGAAGGVVVVLLVVPDCCVVGATEKVFFEARFDCLTSVLAASAAARVGAPCGACNSVPYHANRGVEPGCSKKNEGSRPL
jgi:hypothetical protein